MLEKSHRKLNKEEIDFLATSLKEEAKKRKQ
jgi:hypothetical protein